MSLKDSLSKLIFKVDFSILYSEFRYSLKEGKEIPYSLSLKTKWLKHKTSTYNVQIGPLSIS